MPFLFRRAKGTHSVRVSNDQRDLAMKRELNAMQ